MTINIRNELPEDLGAIEALTKAAFLNAPHTSHTEQYIVNALRKARVLSVSLVAEEGSLLVGHVAVSPITISDGSDGWYGFGPVSVIPDRQGQGIGAQLMEKALDTLQERGARGCVLLGGCRTIHDPAANPAVWPIFQLLFDQ